MAKVWMYLDGKEPLLAMAYFCLTVIETRAGGKPNARSKASNLFAIDEEILNTLGELTSTRGDALTARKALRDITATSLNDKERAWIEAAIKSLIRRVGEYEAGYTQAKLQMIDLPPLSP